MKKSAIVIFICLIPLSFLYVSGLSCTFRNGQQMTNIEIPFSYFSNKTILPVRIGNSKVFRFILDSGMGFDGLLIMNPDLLDSIQLKNPVDARIAGGGEGPGQNAVFSDSMSFTVGNACFNNQRIIILRGDSFRGFSSDGVVGYSLLGHYMVEINNDSDIITLHNFNSTIDSSWFVLPLSFNKNNLPFIDILVSVNNEAPVKLSCYIDYASSETIELLMKDNQKFSLPGKTEEYYLGRGLSGDIHGRKGIISKIIIGPYSLDNIMAAFAPSEIRSKQSDADGVLANRLFRNFNLIFDYQKKKIYLKPNSHFNKEQG